MSSRGPKYNQLQKPTSIWRTIAIAPFLFLIYLYKYLISPLLPKGCRHWPSCSTYGIEALQRFGPFKGSMMAANRVLRCHPWGTHGYDPVPWFLFKKYRTKAFRFPTRRYPRSNRLKNH